MELVQLYPGHFLLGVVYGLSVCSFSCLPFIGPYIIGSQPGFGLGVKSVLIFSLGRLLAYAFLGALAGHLGNMVSKYLGGTLAETLSALLIIWLGYNLFFRAKGTCCSKKDCRTTSKIQPNSSIQLILLGITVGLIPCLPLSGILLDAANSHSAISGSWSTILFGLGTTISPLIILGGGMGWFSARLCQKVPQHNLLFQKVCGVILVSLGIKLLIMRAW